MGLRLFIRVLSLWCGKDAVYLALMAGRGLKRRLLPILYSTTSVK